MTNDSDQKQTVVRHAAGSGTLSPEEFERWDEFVGACPQGTLFHTAWWHRAWGMSPTVKIVADKNGQIEAGICYCVGRRFGTISIVRPPMTPCNGPLFPSCPQNGRHSQNTHAKKMALSAIHALPKLGMYDLILRPGDCDVMPYLWNGFDTHVGYTYVIPCSERESWMQQASKTQRWSVRKAGREIVEGRFTVDESPAIDEVGVLLAATADFKDYSASHYARQFPVWWRSVTDRGVGRAYLLRDAEGKPGSTALMVWDSRCAYYVGGGIRADLRKGSLVNVLLIHRMIEDAHAMNLDFDFEGSILPGVERFFRSFGGELRPYYRLVKLPSPIAYLAWHGYRYWTKHRKRDWIWHD